MSRSRRIIQILFCKSSIEQKFVLSVVLATVPSIVILFIPFVSFDGSGIQKLWAYIIAALFWLSLLLELWVTRMCSLELQSVKQRMRRNNFWKNSNPGIVSFLKTREGAIADMAMLIFLVAILIIALARVKSQMVILICVSGLFLSFNMHCLLNGKNYRYIKLLSNYKKEHEQDE